MDKHSEKRRRAKYPTGQPILPIATYKDDAGNTRSQDNCWKYHQADYMNASNDRNERRRSNPVIDYKKHYRPADFPKTSRNHGISSSSRMKYLVPKIQDECHGVDNRIPGALRSSRNRLSQQYVNSAKCAKNVAIVRKNHYIDDINETGELENSTFTENANLADETREEVVDEEHREDAADFDEKDCEEHEADDEIDEESDVLERQIDKMRLQRKNRMESLPRGEKISSAPAVPRHHRGVKMGKGKTPERCCSSAADRKTAEIPTEEEEEDELEIRECAEYPPQTSSWRSRQREENIYIPGRKLIERFSNLPERCLLTDNHQARRPRTMRPEVKKTMRSAQRYEPICNTKCDRCGATSGHTPKTTSSRNATCRLQDSQYFIGESNGDDLFEGSTRGPITYPMKQRRSKEACSPIYESNEKGITIDDEEKNDIGGIYKPCRGQNSRETTNLRRSSRAVGRRGEKTSSKNKHYWGER